MKRSQIGDTVTEYLRKYPTLPTQRIARMIYEVHPEYGTQETIRLGIRYYRGALGNRNREKGSGEFFNQPYDLPIADTYDSSPFEIKEKCGLVLADAHIPYQDNEVIKTALDWAKHHNKKHKIEFILLNGDTIDFYQFSHFIRDPRKRRIAEEIEDVKDFLGTLKDTFKVPIYYKESNHERRFENYLYTHAEALVGIKEFKLEKVLHLDEYNCTLIGNKRVIRFGHLNIIHGDEFQRGMGNPVNPARTIFLKAKEPTLVAHSHVTSEHSGRTIGRKLITCWSMGSLCQLNPEYAPMNDWNNGMAFIERDKDIFRVVNLRIEGGNVY